MEESSRRGNKVLYKAAIRISDSRGDTFFQTTWRFKRKMMPNDMPSDSSISIQEKNISFDEISTALHEHLHDNALSHARGLLGIISSIKANYSIPEDDVSRLMEGMHSLSDEAKLRESYEAHKLYVNHINTAGYILAHKCKATYVPYDISKDKKFFGM